jgi:hypothetical protein
MTRHRIDRRQHQARRARQPGQAAVAQRLRAGAAVDGMADLPTGCDLGDRDGGEPGSRCEVMSYCSISRTNSHIASAVP